MTWKRLPIAVPIAVLLSTIGALIIHPIVTGIAANHLDEFFKTAAPIWTFISILLTTAFVALLVAARTVQRARQHREEFDLFVPSERLRPEHLRFQVVRRNDRKNNLSKRIYVENTYISRTIIPYSERGMTEPPGARSELQLVSLLQQGKSFLLVGRPTEGKTRTLLEISRRLEGFVVVQPGDRFPSKEAFALLKKRNVLCLFDDINLAVEREIDLLRFYERIAAVANTCVIAAACRDGVELSAVELQLTTSSLHKLYEGIQDKYILRRATQEELAKLGQILGHKVTGMEFSFGDVSMRGDFAAMEHRLGHFTPETRDSLWSLQLLSAAGVEPLYHRRIQALMTGLFGYSEFSKAQIRDCLTFLSENSFILSSGEADPVVPEAAFVSGQQVARLYRSGIRPNQDFDALQEILRITNDAIGLNRFALSLFTSGAKQEAFLLWKRVMEWFQKSPLPECRAEAAKAMIELSAASGDERWLVDADEIFSLDEASAVKWEVARAALHRARNFQAKRRFRTAFEFLDSIECRFLDCGRQLTEVVTEQRLSCKEAQFDAARELLRSASWTSPWDPQQALCTYDEVMRICAEGEGCESLFYQALLGKAKCNVHIKEYWESISIYKGLMDTLSTVPSPEARNAFIEANEGLAKAYIELHDFAAALSVCSSMCDPKVKHCGEFNRGKVNALTEYIRLHQVQFDDMKRWQEAGVIADTGGGEYASGRYEKAIEAYSAAWKLALLSKVLPPERLAYNILSGWAQALVGCRNYEGAVDLYLRLYRLLNEREKRNSVVTDVAPRRAINAWQEPEHVNPHQTLLADSNSELVFMVLQSIGILYHRMERYDLAISSFDKAIQVRLPPPLLNTEGMLRRVEELRANAFAARLSKIERLNFEMLG